MKLYVEKNPFYSNYVAIQQVHDHLPYEITYFNWTEFDLEESKKHDLVVFQTPELATQFDSDTKAVWHLDDAMDVRAAHASPEEQEQKIEDMKRAFSSCVGVVFGNQSLQKRYKGWYKGSYLISQAYIDPCEYKYDNHPSDKVKVGFFGTDHYKDEVLEILPVLKKLKETHGVQVTVMGVDMARKDVIKAGVNHVPHNNDFKMFARDFASQGFNIGVVWYKDKEINLAKTAHKFAQWSWFGIPVVGSRHVTGQVAEGLAILASDTDELYQGLVSLVESSDYRQSLGVRAKKHCQKVYSLHNNLTPYRRFYESLTSRG